MSDSFETRTVLPTGTVTFLFTDIVGSTPMWESQPEQMAQALQVHNAVLRQAIEANGGAVFKTVGDAFQAAFPTALDGLKAAIEGQRALQAATWNELGELKVRMGLHTGEAALDPGGDEYAVSHTKNRIGRIHSIAHGGQILISAETSELVDHQLPEGVTLKDMGEHQLKGMQWLEHLYQVFAPGLETDFTPLHTEAQPKHNLPIELTSFIGRKHEIGELAGLLEKQRLVTLTGVGGTGKTRLALRMTEAVLGDYPDGAWFVELAPLADPELVPRTMIAALGLQESPLQKPLDQLKAYLHQKQLLVVLDNCEHVIADCARISQELLLACPEVKIIATSREALGVVGEVAYPVPSLPLPDISHLPPVEQLKQLPSVQLFIERASAVKPAFSVTPDNAQAVAQVCQRLDGIPLAIELAAARVSVLSPAQIAERLDQRFRLLTGGARTALPRQQTLRASIDWSFSLLAESERQLLLRLSVFQGGWTLELASKVCAFDGLDEFDVLDGLAQLVNKSLAVAEATADGSTRYHRLETIRQYTREKLLDSGNSDALYDRHLDAFLDLAEQAEPHFRGHGHLEWLDRLDVELDNLRVALTWALERDVAKGFRLMTASFWFWYCRGYQEEEVNWLEQLYNRAKETTIAVDPVLLAEARARQAFVMYITRHGDQLTYRVAEEALRLAQGVGAEHQRIHAMALMAMAWNSPTYKSINKLNRQCLAIAEQIGDDFLVAESLIGLASTEPNLAKSKALIDRRLSLLEALGDEDGLMSTYHNLGTYYLSAGEYTQGFRMIEKSTQLARKIRNRGFVVLGLSLQGHIFLEQGEVDKGIQALEQALEEALVLGLPHIFRPYTRLGYAAGMKRDWSQAQGYLQHVIEIARENHIDFWEYYAVFSLAEVAWLLNKLQTAKEYFQKAVALSQRQRSVGLGAYASGMLALLSENLPSAEGYFLAALRDYSDSGIFPGVAECLEALALCLIQETCFEKAVQLHGIAVSYRDWRRFGFMGNLLIWGMVKDALGPVQAALGESRYATLQAGQSVPFDDVVAHVQKIMEE